MWTAVVPRAVSTLFFFLAFHKPDHSRTGRALLQIGRGPAGGSASFRSQLQPAEPPCPGGNLPAPGSSEDGVAVSTMRCPLEWGALKKRSLLAPLTLVPASQSPPRLLHHPSSLSPTAGRTGPHCRDSLSFEEQGDACACRRQNPQAPASLKMSLTQRRALEKAESLVPSPGKELI